MISLPLPQAHISGHLVDGPALLLPLACLLGLLVSVKGVAQPVEQASIYDAAQPYLQPIWHRIADASPRLRSVEAAEFSSDGQWAVSGGKFGYQLMMWRVADGQLMWQNAHESEIECVVFSPDGKRIASGGEDYFLRVWDARTGEELHRMEHDSSLDGITWSHDGKWLAAGTEKGEVVLWDAITYEQKGRVRIGSTVNSLQFTRDDQRLVAVGNTQTPDPETGKTHYGPAARLVDVRRLEAVQTYEGHEASIKSVRISPDEQWIATASFDSTARLYELETGKLLHTFRHPLRLEAVAFSADGHFLMTGGHEAKISFYRTTDYQLAHELPCPRTEYMDVSEDGRLLLTSHEDSGLLSLYLMVSDTQGKGIYHELSNQQLNNRDLKH